MTTYHRTIVVIELLGNRPFGDDDLETLGAATNGGDFSGAVLTTSTAQVSAEHMAALLEMQGSEPGFLGIGSDDEIDPTGERCDTCGDSLVGDMCASDPQHKVSIDPLEDEHTVYGACGVPDCRDCRPLFDADDNIIAGTE